MIKKILIGIGILALILIIVGFFAVKTAQSQPPPPIVANFVDLGKIGKISKFRSCAGHVTVPQDERENKRSMKHYFEVKPEYAKAGAVEIYAPYDGYISVLRSEPELLLEGEIWLAPDRKLFSIMPPFGLWMFSVQHIDARDDLKVGDKIKAGELIGHAAFSEQRNTFDIVYGKMGILPKKIDNWTAPFLDLDSVFLHMSESVFVQYQQKGLTKEKVILTKETRDRNPCVYKNNGPYFINEENSDNWVVLE